MSAIASNNIKVMVEQRNARAQTALGSTYEVDKDGFSQDYAKEFYWYKKAANHAYAQYSLGIRYNFDQSVR